MRLAETEYEERQLTGRVVSDGRHVIAERGRGGVEVVRVTSSNGRVSIHGNVGVLRNPLDNHDPK